MLSNRLFYEDEYDAYATMIGNSGRSLNECASHLYPGMKPGSAYAKLKAKLDPHGSEHLRFSEVVALMRFCDSFDPLMYLCDETLHQRPDRKAPEDEEVRLVEAMTDAAEVLKKAMHQLERLQDRSLTTRPAAIRRHPPRLATTEPHSPMIIPRALVQPGSVPEQPSTPSPE